MLMGHFKRLNFLFCGLVLLPCVLCGHKTIFASVEINDGGGHSRVARSLEPIDAPQNVLFVSQDAEYQKNYTVQVSNSTGGASFTFPANENDVSLNSCVILSFK
jgi:hypothetical protein